MRPFRHEHYAIESKLFGLVQELIDAQPGLSPPETGVTDRMQARFDLKIPGITRRGLL
jgi:hypothetical protein